MIICTNVYLMYTSGGHILGEYEARDLEIGMVIDGAHIP